MLERFLKLAVLILVAVGISAMMTVGKGFEVLNQKSAKMVDDMSAKLAEDMRRDDGLIATGGDPEAMRAAHKALLANAAMPGEAIRHNDRLSVALLTFDTEVELGLSSMAPITLDVSQLKKSGLLLVSDVPVEWTLKGATIHQRAKLAFEGRAPVAVKDMPRGMLAGTRIQGFDANRVIAASAPKTDERSFCTSIRAWRNFFDVEPEDVAIFQISLLSAAPTLRATDRSFLSRDAKSRRLGTAASFCKK